MSLETEIFAAIRTPFLVPGSNPPHYRCYPVTFPQDPLVPETPAARYVFISAEPVEDLCGDDGGRTDNTRTQIDVLATTFAAVRALRQQVIDGMGALPTPTRLAGGFDDYDAELKLYRSSIDFISYPSS